MQTLLLLHRPSKFMGHCCVACKPCCLRWVGLDGCRTDCSCVLILPYVTIWRHAKLVSMSLPCDHCILEAGFIAATEVV